MRQIAVRLLSVVAAFAFAASLVFAASAARAQSDAEEAFQTSLLQQQLGIMAAIWINDESPDLSLYDTVAFVICIVEAIRDLPVEVKEEMLAQENFDDALALAVTVNPEAEMRLAACI
ncbi:MAG: hypothetical protein KIS96_10485 [Bauldia sp.]|nr:hypothetical protein [Bauldia sp.]